MKTNFNWRLFISIGAIAGSIVVAVIALVYLSGDLDANASKLVSDRAAMQANTAALGRLAELEHDAPLAAAYQTAINSLLPTRTDLIDVPPAVATLASADGVTATLSFQGNPAAAMAGSLGTVPFSLDAQGSLDNVTSFLADLETKTTGFLLIVNSFDVTNGAAGAHLTGNGTIYFQ